MNVAEIQSNLANIQQAKRTKYRSSSASNLNEIKETKTNSIKQPPKPIYFKQHSLADEHDFVRQFQFYSPNSKYDKTNELYSASNPWQNLTKSKFNQIQSVINKKFDSFDEHSQSQSRDESMKPCPIKVAKLSLYETLLNKDKFSSTTSIPVLEDDHKHIMQAHRESPLGNQNIVFYVSIGPSSAKKISKSHFEKFKQAEPVNKYSRSSTVNATNRTKPSESSSSVSKPETAAKNELQSTTESNTIESTFKEELNEIQVPLTESHDSFSWNMADKPKLLTTKQRNTLVRTFLTESEILQKENEKFKRMRKLMLKNSSVLADIDMTTTASTEKTSVGLPDLNALNENKFKHKKHKPVNLKNFDQLPLIKRYDISNRMDTALKYTKKLEHRLFFDSNNQSPHHNANSRSMHNTHNSAESSLVELKFPNLPHQPAQYAYFNQNKQ
jgi:hypothetical protein